jgi:hypothetical protein
MSPIGSINDVSLFTEPSLCARSGRSISAHSPNLKNNQPIADDPSMLRRLFSCDRIARQRSIGQAFLGTLLPDTKEYAITAVRPGGYAERKTKSLIFVEWISFVDLGCGDRI